MELLELSKRSLAPQRRTMSAGCRGVWAECVDCFRTKTLLFIHCEVLHILLVRETRLRPGLGHYDFALAEQTHRARAARRPECRVASLITKNSKGGDAMRADSAAAAQTAHASSVKFIARSLAPVCRRQGRTEDTHPWKVQGRPARTPPATIARRPGILASASLPRPRPAGKPMRAL